MFNYTNKNTDEKPNNSAFQQNKIKYPKTRLFLVPNLLLAMFTDEVPKHERTEICR